MEERNKCLEEVEKDGMNLRRFSYDEKLLNDEEIVFTALKNNLSAIRHVGFQLISSSTVLFRLRDLGGDVEQYFEENEVSENLDKWENLLLNKLHQRTPTRKNFVLSFGFETSSIEGRGTQNVEEEQVGIVELKERVGNVRFDSIICYRKLGKGAYGSTYLIRVKGIRGLFVVKVYRPMLNVYEKQREEVVERDSLFIPYHPNVVSILGHSVSEKIDVTKLPDYEEYWKRKSFANTFMGGMVIMKYYRTDLIHYLKQREDSKGMKLSFSDVILILEQILNGGKHLHSNFIVHRDLHPGNIFIDHEKGRAWIGDFGCALDLRENKSFVVKKDDEKLRNFQSGTYDFYVKKGGNSGGLPPEVIEVFENKEKVVVDYSKCDIFSIGMIGKLLLARLGNNSESVDEEDDENEGENEEDTYDLEFLVLKLSFSNFEERETFENAITELIGIKNEHFGKMRKSSESEEVYSEMYERAKILSQSGADFPQSKELWERCLNLAIKIFPHEPLQIADCYYNLGTMKDVLGDSSSAISDYEKSLEIRRFHFRGEIEIHEKNLRLLHNDGNIEYEIEKSLFGRTVSE